jgi:DNA-binding transcriptional MocR family regulator
MADRQFTSKKMRWLNSICSDVTVSHVAFRIAYTIGDHFNSTTYEAWPSNQRMASRIGVAMKTVQRATGELERQGWLHVRRARGRLVTNRYRLRWPEGAIEPADKEAPKTRQDSSQKQDMGVRQSYLDILLRTSSTGRRERPMNFPDRGLYEQRLIQRYGPTAEHALSELNRQSPELLNLVCAAEKDGQFTAADMSALLLHVRSLDK